MGPTSATNVNCVVCTEERGLQVTGNVATGRHVCGWDGRGGRGNGVRLSAYDNGVSGVGVELIYLVLRYEDRRIGVGQVNNSKSSS